LITKNTANILANIPKPIFLFPKVCPRCDFGKNFLAEIIPERQLKDKPKLVVVSITCKNCNSVVNEFYIKREEEKEKVVFI